MSVYRESDSTAGRPIETLRIQPKRPDGNSSGLFASKVSSQIAPCPKILKSYSEKMQLSEPIKNNVNNLLSEAYSAFRRSNWAMAEELSRQILAVDSNNGSGLQLLAQSLWNQNRIHESYLLLEKACQVNPSSESAWYDYGRASFYLRRYDSAVNALVRVSGKSDTLKQIAECYYRLGDLNKACDYFQRANLNEGIEAVKRAHSDIDRTLELISSTAEQKQEIAFEQREFIPILLNKLGLCGKAVEVGVKEGFFSEIFLKNWNGQCLYSVDPWKEFSKESYADSSNVSQRQHDEYYMSTLKRLMPFQGRSVVWRLTSEQASSLIPDASLDFCYIDADHSYAGCSSDIRYWYPKVRSGGILAGHDYVEDGTYSFGVFGVRKAVSELAKDKGIKIFRTNEPEGGFWSWIAKKT